MALGQLFADYIVARVRGLPIQGVPRGNPYDNSHEIPQLEVLIRSLDIYSEEDFAELVRTVIATLENVRGEAFTKGIHNALVDAIVDIAVSEPFLLPELPRGTLTPLEVSTLTAKYVEASKANYDEYLLRLVQVVRQFVDVIPAMPERRLGDHFIGTTKLGDLVSNPEIYDYVVHLLATTQHTFREIKNQLYFNLVHLHGEQNADEPRLKHPASSFDPHLVFSNTPIEQLLSLEVPLYCSRDLRFEHTHILAGTGHGKTQTLQSFILQDLLQVHEEGASVVVIDSQGDLISKIAHAEVFAPGQPLEGKLVLVDPRDIEYPVALNLFHAPTDRLESYSQLIREQTTNGIIAMFDYVFGALLGAEMTSKQETLFRYVTRLLLLIPGATIHTLLELMEPGAYQKFEQYIEKLPPVPKRFFEVEFEGREFSQTKTQVRRRLWAVLENQSFERMMNHPSSKLDLFEEMNSGKVILISTAKDLLKQNGTEIFGRFFIALIVQAALERAAIPENRRNPCYVYIDECQDYVDQNITHILEQARKYRIALTLAHQHLGQIPPPVLKSIHSNTNSKFAGGLSASDTRTMASEMRVSPEFLSELPKGHFVTALKGHRSAIYQTQFGAFDAVYGPMRDADWQQILGQIRKKYSDIKPLNDDIVSHPTTSEHTAAPSVDPTAPSDTWGSDV